MSVRPLPLAGVTVIELGTSLAAPFAALVLAEMGADVIKVEHPDGGDPARRWGPPVSDGGSILFQAVNRDKKSVTVDLSDPEQLSQLKRFVVERADVFIQNMRPGVVADFGLDGKTMTVSASRLVYCNMGAFGAEGPLSHLPGYDPLMQAFTGMCHVTGPHGGEPCRVGVPVIDIGTGMWAVIGIQAALMRRAHTGQGGVVDVSLFETAMGWMSIAMSTVMVTGKSPGRYGTRGPGGVVPNQGFQAADGIIMITAGTDAQFRRLSSALGHPEWAQDEKYASAIGRNENAAELCDAMSEVLLGRTRAEWMQRLNEANVPNAPIHTPPEALAHPHTEASGLLQRGRDDTGPQIALPLSLDGMRFPYQRVAPVLGANNGLLAEDGDGGRQRNSGRVKT